jgi:PEP-CTERM motif
MKTLKILCAAAALSAAAMAPFAARAADLLNEGFGNVSGLSGWAQVNNSAPPGFGWFQGNTGVFGAQSGATDAYIGANFLSAQDGSGKVDNWLITPLLNLNGASTLSFFTRTADEPGFADLLEVRFAAGSGINTGDFTTLLLTIGTNGYPSAWEQYSANINFSGAGRFAFRYLGDASTLNYIGLDTVNVMTPVPEPSVSLMLGLGLGALAFMRRKLSK